MCTNTAALSFPGGFRPPPAKATFSSDFRFTPVFIHFFQKEKSFYTKTFQNTRTFYGNTMIALIKRTQKR